MSRQIEVRAPFEPVGLHEKALEQLTFIRSTMERATSFTAVPGVGGVIMGLTAVAAAVLASRQLSAENWFGVWTAEALIAILIGALAVWRKAARLKFSFRSETGRKFATGFLPPVVAAVILTAPLFLAGQFRTLVAAWLMLYGSGVAAAGTYSARIVPIMGFAFIGLGGITLLLPPEWRDLPLALGFGGLHIVFGLIIARKYGG